MRLEFDRPLLIGAHPDDNALGEGGLMSKWKEEGKEFHCYTATCFDDDRKEKWENAMKFIKPSSYRISPFLASYLEDHKLELRRVLLELKREIDPDVVFTHSLCSSSLDHQLLAKEVRNLFRYQTIFGHAGVMDEGGFNPTLFIEISERELYEKVELLNHFYWETKYQDFMQDEVIISKAIVNGTRAGVTYAEAFDIVRMCV